MLTEIADSIEHWIQEVQRRVTDYEQNIHRVESTTKSYRRINLTEEHNKMLFEKKVKKKKKFFFYLLMRFLL